MVLYTVEITKGPLYIQNMESSILLLGKCMQALNLITR